MDTEISAHATNNTFSLTYLPPNCRPPNYKWVYVKKMNADNTINTKLDSACRNDQTYGIYYNKTYSAKFNSIHTIISICAAKGWSLHQIH